MKIVLDRTETPAYLENIMRALLLAGFVLIAPMARAQPAITCSNAGCVSQATSSGQVLMSSGTGTLTWATPISPQPKGYNTMEAVGVFATIGLTIGGIVSAILFITWLCATLKSFKERIDVLEIPGDVTDVEVANVMNATTREEAHAAIIALRT